MGFRASTVRGVGPCHAQPTGRTHRVGPPCLPPEADHPLPFDQSSTSSGRSLWWFLSRRRFLYGAFDGPVKHKAKIDAEPGVSITYCPDQELWSRDTTDRVCNRACRRAVSFVQHTARLANRVGGLAGAAVDAGYCPARVARLAARRLAQPSALCPSGPMMPQRVWWRRRSGVLGHLRRQ